MPLQTPSLDDRSFQDLLDELRTRIPLYCPEWTDHNVSDPGITLLELFAWLVDILLYRLNQVPFKHHVRLLELLGIQLEPPRAAIAPLTFYLSAPQPDADKRGRGRCLCHGSRACHPPGPAHAPVGASEGSRRPHAIQGNPAAAPG